MKPVVISKLMGGLGNQMFQYAAGRALARRLDVPLLLDRSFLDKRDETVTHTLRDFELDVYRIQCSIAGAAGLDAIWRVEKNPVLRRISNRLPSLVRNPVFRETTRHYMEQFARLEAPVELVGFWQSEKYFGSIRGILLEEFMPRVAPGGLNRELLEQVKATQAISLHVRRTDYLTNAEANRFHGVCSVDYYERAAAHHAEKISDPHFYVFSDDPEWVKANIRLPYPVTFVSHNKGRDSYLDMFLMRHCLHHIIANSSFSWWGAWLGERPGKKVIAPAQWFADPNAGTGDIVPPDWIRL